MSKEYLKYFLRDLSRFKLFHKRYKPTKGGDAEYWKKTSRAYGNFCKKVRCSDYHWYIITFKDGREELAYLRVWTLFIPHGGRLCRGYFFPRYWSLTDYEHTKDIRLAF